MEAVEPRPLKLDFDVEQERKSWEIEDHWALRRDFLVAHKDKFPKDRLLCLAQMFVNIETLGTTYPADLMKEIRELSEDVECLQTFRDRKAELEQESKFKPMNQTLRGDGRQQQQFNNSHGGRQQNYQSFHQKQQQQQPYQRPYEQGNFQTNSKYGHQDRRGGGGGGNRYQGNQGGYGGQQPQYGRQGPSSNYSNKQQGYNQGMDNRRNQQQFQPYPQQQQRPAYGQPPPSLPVQYQARSAHSVYANQRPTNSDHLDSTIPSYETTVSYESVQGSGH